MRHILSEELLLGSGPTILTSKGLSQPGKRRTLNLGCPSQCCNIPICTFRWSSRKHIGGPIDSAWFVILQSVNLHTYHVLYLASSNFISFSIELTNTFMFIMYSAPSQKEKHVFMCSHVSLRSLLTEPFGLSCFMQHVLKIGGTSVLHSQTRIIRNPVCTFSLFLCKISCTIWKKKTA